MDENQSIGINLKYLRRANKYSQEWTANEAGISPAHLRTLEHGKGNPTLNTLKKLAACLGTDVVYLLTEHPEN